MGKRIEDLKIDPTPLGEPRGEPADARASEWYRFVTEINDLLATGQYTWAERTLTDIQATVEKTARVTIGQRQAVKNIEDGIHKSRRRYEGWGRWK